MILRDLLAEDLPVFFEQQSEPDAVRVGESPSRDRESFMKHWTENVLGNASVAMKVIVLDGAVAGYVTRLGGSRRSASSAYWLGARYWGQGHATAALTLFLEGDAIRPLFAIVSPRNAGSIRVLEKCGFERVTVPGGLGEDDDGRSLPPANVSAATTRGAPRVLAPTGIVLSSMARRSGPRRRIRDPRPFAPFAPGTSA